MPPTTHSRFGASKSSRWRNCPGSVLAEDGIADVPSPYATEGTAAHDIAELCLLNGKNAQSYIGLAITVDKEGMPKPVDVVVGFEMAEAVQVYLDFVRSEAKRSGDGLIKAEMFVEHEFTLDALNPPEPVWGTSDCTLWSPGDRHLHVIDYKHGKGVAVSAVGNTQGLRYALGAAVDIAQRTRVRPETITITIVQPRAPHPSGPIRSWDIEWEDLVDDKKVMFEAIEAALEPDAPRFVGDWCRFCKVQATCPAQRTHAEETAMVEFSAAAPEDPTNMPPPAPEDLEAEEIRQVLDRAEMVRGWLKSVEEYALQMAMARGVTIEGYKLVEGRKNRAWTDEEKADSFLARYGVKADRRYKRTLISPAQAEKIVTKDKRHLIEKYWDKPEGAPQLVPITDSRPAIAVGEEFDVLPPVGEQDITE